MEPMTVGVIGCGTISDAYLRGAARSQLIRVKSCADLNPDAARAKATEYAIEAVSVDALLGDPAIDIVINLTVPLAHGPVSRHIITAGKHVYSEKPLAARFSEGQALMAPRIRPVAARSMPAESAGRSRAPRRCSRTAWSTGTRIPSSSTSAAAVRFTMSGPTT
jgi:hypothetical protein